MNRSLRKEWPLIDRRHEWWWRPSDRVGVLNLHGIGEDGSDMGNKYRFVVGISSPLLRR